MLQKSETNNAIITRLTNVRKHPNADRLQLATVLGTQVIVGLDACENDPIIYFDSNLRLSPEYLYYNNLYAKAELNYDKTQKGYFENNGRVKTQKLRGELSNGLAMPVKTLGFIPEVMKNFPLLEESDEFTHVCGVKICEKYVIAEGFSGDHTKQPKPKIDMFWRHWDTKQLMRKKDSIPVGAILYIEEKVHGTSARTGHLLCSTDKKWWQFWKSEHEWKVISGTRRLDHIGNHIPLVRKEIEQKVAPYLHKGEQIYYEIFGYGDEGKVIQDDFTYGCLPHQYKAMLYRVTITTPDGFYFDLDREAVYRRAEELGLEKPFLLKRENDIHDLENPGLFWRCLLDLAKGKSALDANTLREGIVIWFQDSCGKWTALKHKSEEYLMLESKQRDENIGDVEDNL
jgi:hypothetical protein